MYHDTLLKQLAAYRHNTLSVVVDVSEEMADIVPDGFNNNIRWHLGHVYLDQYDWLYHNINEESPVPKHYRELFGFGTKPADWKLSPPTLNELKTRLSDQAEHIAQHFGYRLDEELNSPTVLGMNTFAEILPRTFYHEGVHMGHIIALKKAVTAQTSAPSQA
ncbi:DinB family protein [Fictibacillus iocasae]|uniref:DinB family protein n=1 Tax=Fictibacillus iocasae TaxID=2715437 RepID=A0ABW2NUE6_9BACL